jgi:hypothetical protein
MNATERAKHWQRAAIKRQWAIACWCSMPLLLAIFAVLLARVGLASALLAVMAGLALAVISLRKRINAHDTGWLIQRLDAEPVLENSSDLLFADTDGLSSLQRLQRERTQARLLNLPERDWRQAWPMQAIGFFMLLALAVLLAGFWPEAKKLAFEAVQQRTQNRAAPSALVLQSAQLSITPPGYTGLAARTENSLQAKMLEGSRLQWRLTFNRTPKQVRLVFFGAPSIDLRASGETWRAEKVLTESDVYRIEADGQWLFAGQWKRLDVQADQAPQWRVQLPERSLSFVESGQTQWPLQLEASDDFGLGQAQMNIQLLQGSGENIQFKQFTRPLPGQGSGRQRRFNTRINLNELGMQIGDDLIVQFQISDNRQPKPHTALSSSYILRWPTQDSVQTGSLEGMLKKVMPAYFRSQRQIIIDTEKLLAERKRYTAEQFTIRSDTIGVDQRLLRLRYGQFLGEESESPEPPAGGDAAHHDGDGHDHNADKDKPSEPPSSIQSASDGQSVLEQFGHTHDIPEAATLLDPTTRSLLRSALNEMWQAELHLRSGAPKLALPYEYRALDFIKKVQQGSRIYLARVGPELPPIDEARRLTGERGNLANPSDGLQAAAPPDAPVLALWQALQTGTTPDMPAVNTWIAANPSRVTDVLALKVALAEWQARPDCASCRETLKALLWPILAQTMARPNARSARRSDARYRKLLRNEQQP